jgi:hypothetical protein
MAKLHIDSLKYILDNRNYTSLCESISIQKDQTEYALWRNVVDITIDKHTYIQQNVEGYEVDIFDNGNPSGEVEVFDSFESLLHFLRIKGLLIDNYVTIDDFISLEEFEKRTQLLTCPIEELLSEFNDSDYIQLEYSLIDSSMLNPLAIPKEEIITLKQKKLSEFDLEKNEAYSELLNLLSQSQYKDILSAITNKCKVSINSSLWDQKDCLLEPDKEKYNLLNNLIQQVFTLSNNKNETIDFFCKLDEQPIVENYSIELDGPDLKELKNSLIKTQYSLWPGNTIRKLFRIKLDNNTKSWIANLSKDCDLQYFNYIDFYKSGEQNISIIISKGLNSKYFGYRTYRYF